MQKEDAYSFLIRTAIPKTNIKPADDDEDNLVWDAIWRAHRDVFAGHWHVGSYLDHGKDAEGDPTTEPNEIPQYLYRIVTDEERHVPLTSRDLIQDLQGSFTDVNMGPIQKLVNMTLKYLIILQAFGAQDEVLSKIPMINEHDCDCPIDSTILGSFPEGKGVAWTKLSDPVLYAKLQDAIAERVGPESPLIFDFRNWQP